MIWNSSPSPFSFHPEGIFGKGELFRSNLNVRQLSKSIDIPVIGNTNIILNRTLMIRNIK